MDAESAPLLTPLLPIHLRTRVAKLFSFSIVFICCAICSGPLYAFPTLVPLLVAANFDPGPTQQTDLALIYSISMSATSMTFFITGVIFDRIGAQKTGASGAVFVAVGFVLSWVALKFQSLGLLLFIAFPWIYFCGVFNSFGVFGFLPVFPENQAVILGLSNSCFLVSSSMAYVFIGLTKLGFTLDFAFLMFGGVCLVAAVLVFALTPSKTVIKSLTPPEYQSEPIPLCQLVPAIWKEYKRNSGANTMFLIWTSCLWPFVVFFTGHFYEYYEKLLGEDAAQQLSNVYPIITGVFGALGSPLLGFVFDKIGFKNFLFLCHVGLLMLGVIFVPITGVQYLGMFLLAMFNSATLLAFPQWALLYVSSELFGSFFGLVFFVVGLVQMGVCYLLDLLAAHWSHSVFGFTIAFAGSMGLSFITGLCFHIFIHVRPPEKPPMNENANINTEHSVQ